MGETITAAAAMAGVSRSSVHNWCRGNKAFRSALNENKRIKAEAIVDRIAGLADAAAATLRDILDDPGAPAAIRLKAALAVIATIKDANPAADPQSEYSQFLAGCDEPLPQATQTQTLAPTVADQAEPTPVAVDSQTAEPGTTPQPLSSSPQPAPQSAQAGAPSQAPSHEANDLPDGVESPGLFENSPMASSPRSACGCGSGKKFWRCCGFEGARMAGAGSRTPRAA